ncbi:MAG: tRNA (cytidine(34)-2'-O)-methyltransferase [Alphaproteobacteria bacterium]|nr:tRNA (cytidine(34)-2'-O)-methyltransferase [Alphaproteobacteria bacterium]
MRLALYQPDIPQNVGSAIRLCACLGVPLDIIEPCGFIWDKRKIEQAALDYYPLAQIEKHMDWADFVKNRSQSRLVLMTTKASLPYTDFKFEKTDILIAGRESAGVPDEIHNAVQGRVYIPMHGAARSLNVINASSMILGEALRQVNL